MWVAKNTINKTLRIAGRFVYLQVISVQKPMLLDSLLAFEEVVMQPTLTRKGRDGSGGGSVTWR